MRNKGKINVIPIFVLVIALALLILGAVAIRHWNKSKKMSEGLRLGLIAYEQKDWMEAATQLGYYLGGAQDDIEILSKYAECLTKARPTEPSRLMSAANTYKIILRNDKTNVNAVEKASDIYIAIGSPGEAELMLSNAIELLPENEDLHNKYALSLAIQRKLDKLLELKNQYPDQLKAYYQFIAELCTAEDKYSIASDILMQVIDKYPEEISAYQSMVNLILQKNYKNKTLPNVDKVSVYKEMEPWVKQAEKSCPDSPKLYLMLANIALWNQEFNQVPIHLNKALELTKDDEQLIKIQIASIYSQLEQIKPENFKGMTDLAINICTNIVDKDPGSLRAWKALIGFIRLANNQQLLNEITEKALNSLDNTSRWDFIPTAIENYTSLRENEKAMKLINEVEESKVMEARVAYWKSLIARNNNDSLKEIDLLNKAILLGYNNNLVKIQLANAYRNNNDISSAILHLREVHEKSPDIRSVTLDLANLYLQTQQFNDAIATAQQLLQRSENDADAIAIVLQANIQAASKNELKDPENSLYASILAEISKQMDKFANPLIPKRIMFSLAVKAEKFDDAYTIIEQLKNDKSVEQVDIENLQLSLFLNKSQYFESLKQEEDAQKSQNEAIKILKKQVNSNPDNISLTSSLASLLASNNKFNEALSMIDHSLETAKSTASKRNLIFTKSDIILAEDKNNKVDNPENRALAVIENYLTDNPQDITALRKTLYFKSVINDAAKAKNTIDSIKEIEGTDGRIWKIEFARYCLLQEEFNKADAQDAITQLKDILTKNPFDHECAATLARLYEKDDQLQLAANLWLEIHNRYLNNIQFADSAIRCLRRAGQNDRANDLIQQMLAQKPDDPLMLGHEVVRLLETNQSDKAEAILEKLYSNGSDSITQIVTLANMYYNKAENFPKENTNDKEAYYKKALQLCNDIIADNTYNYEAYSIKVGAMLGLGRNNEAKTVCDKALVQNLSAQSYLLMARFYLNTDDTDSSLENLEKACTFDNLLETDYASIIVLYTALQDTNDAVKYGKMALNQFPDNLVLARQVISLLLFPATKPALSAQQINSLDENKQEELVEQKIKEMAKEGKQLLDTTMTKHPDDNLLKTLKSRFLIDSGTKPELSTARKLLTEVVSNQTDNLEAWLLLIQIEFKGLQYERAIDIINTALQYFPEQPALIFQKAEAESRINPELAKLTLEKISSLASTDANIGIRLASIYLTRNEPEQALKLLDTAEKLTQNKSQLQTITILRILASYKQGNKEVINEINQILSEQPNNIDALIAKVDMLIFDENWNGISATISQWEQNNPDDLQSLLNVVSMLLRHQKNENAYNMIFELTDKIIAKEPDNIAALQVQAALSNINQDIQKAIERYNQILKYDPENTVAMNNLAWVLSEELNKPNEALKLTEKALEINENYADLNDTTGVIYFRLGNYGKSIEKLEKAVSLYNNNDPELVNTFFHLGRSHYLAGNKVEAGKFLQRAKEFNESTNTLTDKDKTELNELLSSDQ